MAISLIQSTTGSPGSAVASFGLAFTSTVTAGSCLVAGAGGGNNGATFTASDNLNGSWTTAASNGAHGTATLAFFPNSLGGSITVTITISPSQNIRVGIAEIGGVAVLTPLDQTGNNSGITTTSPTVSTSGATTSATEAVVALIQGNLSVTWSNLGPGTLITPSSGTTQGMMFFTTSSTGVQTWNPTVSSSSTYAAAILSLLPQPANQPQAIYTRKYVQFYT